MTIAYNDTVADARLQVVVDAIDQGSGPGVLVIGTSALAGGSTGVLVEVTMDDPCGTVASRVLTFSGTPIDATATGAGVAAKAEIRDSDGVVIVSGLTVGVTGSGSDITMDTTNLVVDRPCRWVSGSITHP